MGRHRWRSSPLSLATEASQYAIRDSGVLPASIDAIGVIRTMEDSTPFGHPFGENDNLPGSSARNQEANPRFAMYSKVGGQSLQKLVIASLQIERCMTGFVSGYYMQSLRFKYLQKLASNFFNLTPDKSIKTIDLYWNVSLYPNSLTRWPNIELSFRKSKINFPAYSQTTLFLDFFQTLLVSKYHLQFRVITLQYVPRQDTRHP